MNKQFLTLFFLALTAVMNSSLEGGLFSGWRTPTAGPGVSKPSYHRLTREELIANRRKSVADYKRLLAILAAAGITPEDSLYKRAHAALQRSQTRLQHLQSGRGLRGLWPRRHVLRTKKATRPAAQTRVKRPSKVTRAKTVTKKKRVVAARKTSTPSKRQRRTKTKKA